MHDTNYVGPSSIAEHVMEYAHNHYTQGGWDFIVECNSVSEIEAELAKEGIKTKSKALQFYRDRAEILNDRRNDIRGY